MSSLYHELSPHIWEWALCTMNYHPIFENELFVSWTITPYWSVLYLFGGFPSGSCAIMKCCFCTFSASPVASELPKIPFVKLVPEGNPPHLLEMHVFASDSISVWKVAGRKSVELSLRNVPVGCKEGNPLSRKYTLPFFKFTWALKLKAPILWSLDAKNWLTGKDPDAGKGGERGWDG